MALVGPPGDGGRAEGARDRRSGTPESRPQLEELRFAQVSDEAVNRRATLQNLVDVTRRHLELGTDPTQMLPPPRGLRRQDQPHGSSRAAGGWRAGGGGTRPAEWDPRVPSAARRAAIRASG